MAILRKYMGHPFRVATTALYVVLVAHVFFEHFYEIAATRGASMLSTFHVYGDILVTNKHFRRGRDVKVGDVVSFKSVYEPGERVIKRVIGMPGDYVMMDTPGSGSDTMLQVSDPYGEVRSERWLIGIGAAGTLLGDRRQPPRLEGLKNTRTDTAGIDQGKGHIQGVSVEREEEGGEWIAEAGRGFRLS